MKFPPSNALARYRPDIDGLRALAILAVVAFHAFPDIVRGGFIGVDIFFVISGYLISGIILDHLGKETFSFRTFYARRIRRIFPALLLVLIACYIAGWFVLLPDEFKRLGKHIAGSALFVPNIMLWREAGYFDRLSALKPLLHLWSLGIEEQFYLAWPLTLYLAWKWRLNVLYVTLAVAMASFALNIYLVHTHPVADFYWPVTRFWELLSGGALACRERRSGDSSGQRSRIHGFAAALGLAVIMVPIFKIDNGFSFPGWWVLLPVAGACVLIATGPHTWIHRRLLSNRAMVWVGLISYPLYLWHWSLLAYLRIFFLELAPIRYRLAVAILSILFAWLTYRFIERPIRFGKHNTAKVVLLLAAMVAMDLLGLETYKYNGFPSRLPDAVRQFVPPSDMIRDWRLHTCFLDPDNNEKFDNPDICIEKGEKPLVLLWGDSHGAALYPGLKSLESEHGFRLAQFTTSACPPVLNLADRTPHEKICNFNNNVVFALIQKIHPDIVLLQARWEIQPGDETTTKLGFTLSELKKSGAKRIILIGPTPRWRFKISTIERLYWLADKTPQLRMNISQGDIPQANVDMQAIAREYGVEYISAYDPLCNSEGCLMHGGGGDTQALLFDSDHLSVQGSQYLMHLLAGQLFP